MYQNRICEWEKLWDISHCNYLTKQHWFMCCFSKSPCLFKLLKEKKARPILDRVQIWNVLSVIRDFWTKLWACENRELQGKLVCDSILALHNHHSHVSQTKTDKSHVTGNTPGRILRCWRWEGRVWGGIANPKSLPAPPLSSKMD